MNDFTKKLSLIESFEAGSIDSEAHSEFYLTFKMELMKLHPLLIIFAKHVILEVWQIFEYVWVSVSCS